MSNLTNLIKEQQLSRGVLFVLGVGILVSATLQHLVVSATAGCVIIGLVFLPKPR